MGLLTIIRKNKLKSREIRLLILGLDNAGKTTILRRINNEDISIIAPTLGFNIKSLIHRGLADFTLAHSIHLTLSLYQGDIGGQKSLRPYWQNYFEKTDCIIWVVDSVATLRLDDCRIELHSLLQQERLQGASLVIFANKSDIDGALTSSELQTILDLQSIKSHNWTIVACSAKTGQGLLQGFDWLIKEVSTRMYYSASAGTIHDSGPMQGLREFEDDSVPVAAVSSFEQHVT